MSHGEISLAFLSRHERTRKLRLLTRTLADYIFAIQFLKLPLPDKTGNVPMSLSEFNVGILDVLISDLYVLLPEEDKELWPNLRALRSRAQAINEVTRIFRMRYFGGILPVDKVVKKHNEHIDTLVPDFVTLIETVTKQLDKYGIGGGLIP